MTATTATAQALALAIASREPVLLWGAPGTGKSSLVTECAETAGLTCEVVIASIREPSDFSGLPVVGKDGSVAFAPPRWARRLADAGRGVLFLDELSTAPPAVQAALLRVVLDGEVGDLALPNGVSVVAAANPPEQAASGWNLAAPLANRFCHLEWTTSGREVADGLTYGFKVPELPQLGAVTPHVTRWRPLAGGFIRARPDLHLSVPDDEFRAGRGWPSPRSWDMAIRLAAAASSVDAPPAVLATLITGCVGDAAGLEFLEYVRNLDLPDPEQLLADPDGADLPARPDRLQVALASVVAATIDHLTADRYAGAWRILERAATDHAPDVAALPALELARHQPPGQFASIGALRPFIPLLRQAGLFDTAIS